MKMHSFMVSFYEATGKNRADQTIPNNGRGKHRGVSSKQLKDQTYGLHAGLCAVDTKRRLVYTKDQSYFSFYGGYSRLVEETYSLALPSLPPFPSPFHLF